MENKIIMLPFTHVPKEREKKCDKVTITQSYRLTIQKASLKKKKKKTWVEVTITELYTLSSYILIF